MTFLLFLISSWRNFKGHTSSWIHTLLISRFILSFIFLVSLNSADCQGPSRDMCWAARPISPTMPAPTNGACQPSCHTATAHPGHTIRLNFVKALPLLPEERGFETFDGGNKGLGGGSGKLGKKWNVLLAFFQQDWGWVGLSVKRRAGNAMYTLLQSKEAFFVSFF